jgi:hypothetical protein
MRYCKGTKANNSRSYQHCRDQAFGDLGLELFHRRAFYRRCEQVSTRKNKNLINGICGWFRQFGQQQNETTNYLNAADRKVAPKWPHSKARFADKIEGSDFSSSATATTALTHRG